MKTRFALIGIGVVIGLGLIFVAWQIAERNYTYQGSQIDPPVLAADFTLTDQNGSSFNLNEQNGKIVLIFFGYTHCPDVCPITLSEYKQIKKELGVHSADMRFVFVTVDPERDTVDQLQAYIPNFDAEFIGLTGSRGELEQVWKNYGVYQAKNEADSQGGYLVDHTSRIYLVDQDGNWRITYPFGMEVNKMVQDIEHLLREN